MTKRSALMLALASVIGAFRATTTQDCGTFVNDASRIVVFGDSLSDGGTGGLCRRECDEYADGATEETLLVCQRYKGKGYYQDRTTVCSPTPDKGCGGGFLREKACQTRLTGWARLAKEQFPDKFDAWVEEHEEVGFKKMRATNKEPWPKYLKKELRDARCNYHGTTINYATYASRSTGTFTLSPLEIRKEGSDLMGGIDIPNYNTQVAEYLEEYGQDESRKANDIVITYIGANDITYAAVSSAVIAGQYTTGFTVLGQNPTDPAAAQAAVKAAGQEFSATDEFAQKVMSEIFAFLAGAPTEADIVQFVTDKATAQIADVFTAAVTEIATQVGTMKVMGFQKLVVAAPVPPGLGSLPSVRVRGEENVAQALAAGAGFNANLKATIEGMGVHYMDLSQDMDNFVSELPMLAENTPAGETFCLGRYTEDGTVLRPAEESETKHKYFDYWPFNLVKSSTRKCSGFAYVDSVHPSDTVQKFFGKKVFDYLTSL